MKKNLFFTIVAGCLLSSAIANAKPEKDLIKANYLYGHLAYHEAIAYYNKPGVNMNDPIVLSKLGDCYRLTKMFPEANDCYQKALAMNDCPADTWLHDGQVLMTLERYDKAKEVLTHYQAQKQNDSRVANMITSCSNAEKMKAAMPEGTIWFESFNSDGSDFGPALHGNDLYYTSDTFAHTKGKTDEWTGEPFYGIFRVPLSGTEQSKGVQASGGHVNSKYHDGPCTFSADGKQMYFTRTSYQQKFLSRGPIPDNNSVVHLEIMIASDYDEAKKEYKKISSFPFNSKNYSCAHPALSKDGKILIFSSDMAGGLGGTDLYICKRKNDGGWTAPANMGKGINTEGDEMFPFLDWKNDLYYSSDGLVGLGGLDVYQAKLSADNTFADPTNMGIPVNSSYDDMSFIVDDSYKTGYFASNRPAKMQGDNIYKYSKQEVLLNLSVVDDRTNEPIRGATVLLSGKADERMLTTDGQGQVNTRLYPFITYNAAAYKPRYDTQAVSITSQLSAESTNDKETISKTIRLKRDNHISLGIIVVDEATRQPIETPKLVFVKNEQHTQDTVQLRTGEIFNGGLMAGQTYSFYAIKNGYYGNEKYISTRDITPEAGNVTMTDTLFMKHLEVGQVYKIDNIYYDFNKATIRQDAQPSLNRLIELLNTYPDMHIQVNSHTDCRGADAYNLRLSNARAQSVIKYLTEKGIKMGRLKAKGFGETMPVDKCAKCEECTEEQHQKNRRTEFQIISM